MAEPALYLQSVKDPDKMYRVMEFNTETKVAKVQGRYAPFEMTLTSKADLEKRGYRLVQKDGE